MVLSSVRTPKGLYSSAQGQRNATLGNGGAVGALYVSQGGARYRVLTLG
jgi:hypothetical protein